MNSRKPAWIYSPLADSIFILSPPFFSLLLVLLFPAYFGTATGLPVLSWVILILFIDVAHVYSTLYRTYFDPEIFLKQRTVLVFIPVLCLVTGVIIYSISGMLFWRLLAYLAVFHFIRQQYGFLRIYSRNEQQSKTLRYIDNVSIYVATIYPILYWHLHAPRNFNWFVDGDFLFFESVIISKIGLVLYLSVIALYVCKEIAATIKSKQFNIPRNILVIGTFLSWYFGIIYFNGDLAFTTINVVSHGIPYMALVWMHGKKKHKTSKPNTFLSFVFSKYGILCFVGIIVLLAYIEEGLWDALVWQEHTRIFSVFKSLPNVKENTFVSILIPSLSLPQVTHYVLDGFIWKMTKDKYNWKTETLKD